MFIPRYLYSMVITFMYQSVLINKLTVVELLAPVDSLAELFLQDLTPFIYYRRYRVFR